MDAHEETTSVVQKLRRLTEGLPYPSEGDEEIEVFCLGDEGQAFWEGGEEMSFKEWMEPLQDVDVVGEEGIRRFAEVAEVLERELQEVRVFRVPPEEGKKVDVYVVGRHRSNWVGLHTRSVET